MNIEVFAPALMNRFLWETLKHNQLMLPADYPVDATRPELGNYVPIVPLSEEPELSQFSKPYIVYGFSETYHDGIPYKRSGSVSYVAYSQSVRAVNGIINLIAEVFGEEDISAARLNKYTSFIPGFIGIRFTMTKVGYIESAEPEESEGGRVSALINIRYDYVPEYSLEIEPNSVNSSGIVTSWD